MRNISVKRTSSYVLAYLKTESFMVMLSYVYCVLSAGLATRTCVKSFTPSQSPYHVRVSVPGLFPFSTGSRAQQASSSHDQKWVVMYGS